MLNKKVESIRKIVISLLAVISFNARAEMLCYNYNVHGDLNISHICADVNTDGSFEPLLIGDNGDWQISKGFFAKKRSKKICRALGFSDVEAFKVGKCFQEKMPVNMKGNYSHSSLFPSLGTGECIIELSCK